MIHSISMAYATVGLILVWNNGIIYRTFIYTTTFCVISVRTEWKLLNFAVEYTAMYSRVFINSNSIYRIKTHWHSACRTDERIQRISVEYDSDDQQHARKTSACRNTRTAARSGTRFTPFSSSLYARLLEYDTIQWSNLLCTVRKNPAISFVFDEAGSCRTRLPRVHWLLSFWRYPDVHYFLPYMWPSNLKLSHAPQIWGTDPRMVHKIVLTGSANASKARTALKFKRH